MNILFEKLFEFLKSKPPESDFMPPDEAPDLKLDVRSMERELKPEKKVTWLKYTIKF